MTKTIQSLAVARIYMRVSTEDQDLKRQDTLIDTAKAAGYYVGGIYREKASGVRADRPELLRMIEDLQPGETVIAEAIDRISRLPLPEAEKLIDTIRGRGAKLAIPGIVDFSELANESKGVTQIVLQAMQDMLLKIALQLARDDYENRRERQQAGIAQAKAEGRYKGRRASKGMHEKILMLRSEGLSLSKTAKAVGCCLKTVQNVQSAAKKGQSNDV
jgi:DNA invertase Pin-like site-specific DNA recombinase